MVELDVGGSPVDSETPKSAHDEADELIAALRVPLASPLRERLRELLAALVVRLRAEK